MSNVDTVTEITLDTDRTSSLAARGRRRLSTSRVSGSFPRAAYRDAVEVSPLGRMVVGNHATRASLPRDEPAMLAGLRRGERAAFNAVYVLYGARLYRYLLRLSGDREVAADLAQETWEKLTVHATRLREDSDVGAWIFTVARGAIRNYLRFRASARARLAPTDGEGVASTAPTPEALAAARQSIRRIERVLASLPFAASEALFLVATEGVNQERAAEMVGVSHDAFRQRVSRARDELARRLESF